MILCSICLVSQPAPLQRFPFSLFGDPPHPSFMSPFLCLLACCRAHTSTRCASRTVFCIEEFNLIWSLTCLITHSAKMFQAGYLSVYCAFYSRVVNINQVRPPVPVSITYCQSFYCQTQRIFPFRFLEKFSLVSCVLHNAVLSISLLISSPSLQTLPALSIPNHLRGLTSLKSSEAAATQLVYVSSAVVSFLSVITLCVHVPCKYVLGFTGQLVV